MLKEDGRAISVIGVLKPSSIRDRHGESMWCQPLGDDMALEITANAALFHRLSIPSITPISMTRSHGQSCLLRAARLLEVVVRVVELLASKLRSNPARDQ